MVQPLKDLIESPYCDKASLKEALSSFVCIHDEDSVDVISFLQQDAIDYEIAGMTRTYLILNDEAASNNIMQIDGYFAIAIKNLYFKNTDKHILQEAFGDPSRQNCTAYLIGQLARSKDVPRGSGAIYLRTALSYIISASNIVGGKLVYLDCEPNRRSYYEENGFSFLQQKNKSNLIQMYRII